MQTRQLQYATQILITLMLVVATLLLGLGNHTPWLTLLTILVGGVSMYVVDVKGWFQLKQGAADMAALAVMLVTALVVMRSDRQGQMNAVADLQSYLQYVLLFKPKSWRICWQLCLLSLGQVAIASTVTTGPVFGVLLVVYLLLGLVAIAMALAVKQSAAYETPTAADATPARTTQRSKIQLRGGVAPVSWQYSRGLVGQALAVCLLSVAVAAPIFFAMPRWTVRDRQVPSREALRSVGFSKTVALGEIGSAINDPDLVMRVQFFHGRSRRPFQLRGEPLFRGALLETYDGHTWTQQNPGQPRILSTTDRTAYVRQRLTIEPMDVNELFAVFPVFALESERRIRVSPNEDQIFRLEDLRSSEFDFDLGTTGIVGDMQLKVLPCTRKLGERAHGHLLQMPANNGSGTDRFPGLRELATKILRDADVDVDDRMTAAQTLSDYFHKSGRFFYTLDAPPRDPELDPLEDFVTENLQGHCEYFAGALVMMLRSLGIPARMAIGYKGGEWNPLGEYYQVQQLHAHAWVEAYLGPGQFPEENFSEEMRRPEAAWLVLDPTEGTQEVNALANARGLLMQLRQYIDYGQVLWSKYVSGMNASTQRQGVYEPISQGAIAAMENLFGAKVWQARMKRLANSSVGTHVGAFWEWYRRHWFSWRGGMVAIGFSMLLVGVYFTARGVKELLRKYGLVGGKSDLLSPQVHEIYRRLEVALAARGFERHAAQTPYEFALSVGGQLAENLEHRRIAHLPRRVVESFYRIRFGGRTLDSPEADAVEHALKELELAFGSTR